MSDNCYCGSGKSFVLCCESIIKGDRTAATAEELMRSRYSAYATTATDYILKTTHSSVRKNHSASDIEAWAKSSKWVKLDILSRTLGGTKDERGEVEFKAYYFDTKEKLIVHHENSDFVKEAGQWYFVKGTINPISKTMTGKTNRNDPCPCGSGLKFKKCCG
jgi:SEC-C motif-containing protein